MDYSNSKFQYIHLQQLQKKFNCRKIINLDNITLTILKIQIAVLINFGNVGIKFCFYEATQ